MNQFLPLTGGHSLHNDDAMLMQGAYFDGFKAISFNFSPTGNVIFSGVYTSIVSSNLVWTAGYIAINGEVFDVASGSMAYTDGTLYLKPQQTVLAPSPVQYEDGGLKNVHFQRKATLIYTNGSDTDGANYSNMIRPSVHQAGDLQDWIVPVGHIVSEYFDNTGLGINSRQGWAICNGLNGAPDLRGFGRMQATNVPSSGAGTLSGNLGSVTNNVGDVAGYSQLALTQANLPICSFPVTEPNSGQGHKHHISASNQSNFGGFNYVPGVDMAGPESGGDTDYATTGIIVSSGGSGTPIENRPAVFYVYTLMKLP